MNLECMKNFAEKVKDELGFHCERIEIAGSIRRETEMPNDVDIVCIPKIIQGGFFQDDVDRDPLFVEWIKYHKKLSGCPIAGSQCKVIDRPTGIQIDIYITNVDSWGYILALRTGSERFSHNILIEGINRNGFRCHGGKVHVRQTNVEVPCQEEADFFKMAGVTFIKPKERK